MRRTIRPGTLILQSLFVLAGGGCTCGDTPKAAQLPGDERVLAKVNDSPISEYDVAQAIQDTFGAEGARALDEAARKKVLESLVTSRAIALAREKELTPEQRAHLDRAVARDREERLVKAYLSAHAPPEPVSTAMIEHYYNAHRDRFGATPQRKYELILSERELNSKERDALIGSLRDPQKNADWRGWVERLKQEGHPVGYSQGSGNEAALHPALREAMARLNTGQSSSLLFVQNRAYLVRVTDVQQAAARPLSEVSAEIRETLTPVQVKKALSVAGAAARKKAQIAYMD